MNTFYITTPIYYVNAKPHLGHAYTTIVADTLARFHRIMGKETFFLTGTDEHGDKILQAAEAAGESPQEYADRISGLFQNLWPHLGIDNNDFIRTTEKRHKRCVQEVLQKVYDSGDIYFGEYGGHYCFGCERFFTDKELVDGLCPDHQTEPKYIVEKNYFFRMSKYQGWLIDHIKKTPDFIRPDQYRREVLSLLESGALEDLCISRPKTRLTWGVDLPFDPEYVTYVWFDALLNYVSALGYPEGERYKKFWPAASHLVAKDILKPHAIFWPTMLKAAGIEPYNHLNVHGYWLIKETKMSKSLGNVVEPLDMAEKYGLAAFRYFLLREMQFGSDASFSEEALVGRFNADLANDLGNLFNRTLAMTHKYFDGKVPTPPFEADLETEALLELAVSAMENYQSLFPQCRFARALEALWEMIRGCNKYIDTMAPWTLFKENRTEELALVMYTLLDLMRKTALHLWPVMPGIAEEMLEQLGQPPFGTMDLTTEISRQRGLEPGTPVAKRSTLFPRVELQAGDKAPNRAEPKKKPGKPTRAESAPVEFPDFQKLDLRVGTVVSAEPHPDADKLLKLMVDIGEDQPRQIIAGLAAYYRPEELPGRQVTVLANLSPKKLRGLVSQGMVLAVKSGTDLTLLTPAADVENGSKVS
ncbi:MAG: methionine--tRNA ligase [Desulfovibrionales bacterium]